MFTFFLSMIEILLYLGVPDNQISLHFDVSYSQISLYFDVPNNWISLNFDVPNNCLSSPSSLLLAQYCALYYAVVRDIQS